jgi:hypothetical protein
MAYGFYLVLYGTVLYYMLYDRPGKPVTPIQDSRLKWVPWVPALIFSTHPCVENYYTKAPLGTPTGIFKPLLVPGDG